MPDDRELAPHEAERMVRRALRTDPATEQLADGRFHPVPGGLSNFAWHVVPGRAGACFVRLARRYGQQLGADHVAECRVLEGSFGCRIRPCAPRARPRFCCPREVTMAGRMLEALAQAPDWMAAEMPPGYQTRLLEIERLSADLHAAAARPQLHPHDRARHHPEHEHAGL